MAPDTPAPNPSAGGSYVRHEDGSLELVERTKPAEPQEQPAEPAAETEQRKE